MLSGRGISGVSSADLPAAGRRFNGNARRVDLVDRYRDQIFERLLEDMRKSPGDVNVNLQLVLASRHLERLADHATNIAEDIIFWVRGLDVRHGRGANLNAEAARFMENS